MAHMPKAQWAPRFAATLKRLQPSRADDGLDAAESTWMEAGDLLPELAARIYSMDELPRPSRRDDWAEFAGMAPRDTTDSLYAAERTAPARLEQAWLGARQAA